jgi:predicted CoA-binding protein
VIKRLLTTPATWAVVGLSANTRRTAYSIGQYLRDQLGMSIVPVNLRGENALGERGYRRLADITVSVQVVDSFVNSQRIGAVVDQAIAEKDRLGIQAVWLQLGVIDEAAADPRGLPFSERLAKDGHDLRMQIRHVSDRIAVPRRRSSPPGMGCVICAVLRERAALPEASVERPDRLDNEQPIRCFTRLCRLGDRLALADAFGCLVPITHCYRSTRGVGSGLKHRKSRSGVPVRRRAYRNGRARTKVRTSGG